MDRPHAEEGGKQHHKEDSGRKSSRAERQRKTKTIWRRIVDTGKGGCGKGDGLQQSG